MGTNNEIKHNKRYMIKKANFLLIILVLLFSLGMKCYYEYLFLLPINSNTRLIYGVIDGSLNAEHSNVVETNAFVGDDDTILHGDSVLEFIERISPRSSVYYYNAEDESNITTDAILEGLEWMLDKKVDCVTISLSGKRYSEELEEWITRHCDDIKVYASYNNLLNTFDYPAQYDKVIGVGTNELLNGKDMDVLYRTHEIIVLSGGIKIYSGNSYLAPYTMLKNY